ncbi:U1 zinc finger-domain-containing protein [Gautieria morchelliformis]|nr:U1 zinc finger-domain-containing protein [Gautieria morchelliformis]
MPKHYCESIHQDVLVFTHVEPGDYCDVFLTHDSTSVRKAHNSGRNHLSNVRDYYASLGHDKAQNIIDQITSARTASWIRRRTASSRIWASPTSNSPPQSGNTPGGMHPDRARMMGGR